MTSRARVLAAAAGAAVLVAALAAPSAGSGTATTPAVRAAEEGDEATVGSFSLLAEGPAAVTVGDRVEFDLEIPDPERDLVVAVEVYAALEDRDAVLDAAASSGRPPLDDDTGTVAVGELAESATGGRRLLLDVRDQGADDDADDPDADDPDADDPAETDGDDDPATVDVPVPGPGVYPVTLFLHERAADGEGSSRIVGVIDTALVVVDATPSAAPLSFAWVWPLGAAPGLTPDGSVVPDVAAELGSGGRVQALACAAQALSVRTHPLPLTLVPTPETVSVWATLPGAAPAPVPTTTTSTTTTTVPPTTTTTVPPTEPVPPDTGFGGTPTEPTEPIDTQPVETVPETTTTAAPTTTTTTPLPTVDLATSAGYPALLDAVAHGAEVVASPWVDVDLPLLEAGGVGDELPDLRATGADALAAALADALAASGASRPVGQIQVGGRLDEPSLARLREVDVDRLVVDPASLLDRDTSDGGPAAVPLTRRFIVDSGDRQFESAAVDTELTRLLTAPTDTPVETAQWALALLVATAAEATPAEAGTDDQDAEDDEEETAETADAATDAAPPSLGLVALAPDDWVPDTQLLAQVTSGLEDTPLAGHVEAVTLTDWFQRVDFEVFGATATVDDVEPGTPTVTADQLAQSRADTAALRALLGGDAPEVAIATVDARRALARQLDAAEAAAYLGQPQVVIESFEDVVRAPNGRTLRFTDRAVDVPLQIQNLGDRPLQVEVVVSGENLTFPEGSSSFVELPAGENVVVTVAVESRYVCHSDLDITVQAPGSATSVLATGRLEVRVTTLGPVSLALTAGAAGFLALWWGMHWRRSRRRQRAAG